MISVIMELFVFPRWVGGSHFLHGQLLATEYTLLDKTRGCGGEFDRRCNECPKQTSYADSSVMATNFSLSPPPSELILNCESHYR